MPTQQEQDSLQHQQDQELLVLEAQLKESLAAESFFETASGRIVVDILTKEITQLTRKVTSDEFLKDHMGYVTAVAKLQANQNLLKRLQLAASPVRRTKIQEKMNGGENV